MHVAPKEHLVPLTEAPEGQQREDDSDHVLDLQHQGCVVVIQAVLSLCTPGQTTGIVMNPKDRVTHTVSIYHTLLHLGLVVWDLTDYLMKILMDGWIQLHYHCGVGNRA